MEPAAILPNDYRASCQTSRVSAHFQLIGNVRLFGGKAYGELQDRAEILAGFALAVSNELA
jgi:hypothetical protein